MAGIKAFIMSLVCVFVGASYGSIELVFLGLFGIVISILLFFLWDYKPYKNKNQSIGTMYYYTCSKCGVINPTNYSFCKNCGNNLNMTQNNAKYCTQCGNQLQPTASFCTSCGIKQN